MLTVYRGISSEAKYLIYQSIFPSIAYGMLFTDISYFLTSIQGLSYSFMGLVISTMGISAFVASIPLGIAADKFGRKKTLILGTVIAGLAMTAFAFTTNPSLLLIIAVFEGVSEAALSASAGALMAEKAEASKRNSVFSLFGFAQSIAFGVGSIAIPIVLVFEYLGFSSEISHGLLFFTFGLLSLCSLLFLLKVHEKPRFYNTKEVDLEATKNSRKQSRTILAKYVLPGAVIAVGAGMVVPLMTAWLRLQYGIPDTVSGPILGFVSIIIGVATLTGPMLAKRFGLSKSIVITQGMSTVFMLATPLMPTFATASSVYTIRAFLMNMASPLSQSMIMGLVREDERGMASGVNTALWRLPSALSTYVGAALMSLGFLSAPFFLASGLYALSIGLFWYFFRKTKMPEEQQNAGIA